MESNKEGRAEDKAGEDSQEFASFNSTLQLNTKETFARTFAIIK